MPDYDGFLPSSLARGTGNLRQQTERLVRELQNRILDIEQGIGFVLRGDLVSDNWDGADPPVLTSRDTAATEGIAIDTSAGAVQAMGDFFLGGDFSLGPGGVIKTADSGERIELNQSDWNRIFYYSGDPDESYTSRLTWNLQEGASSAWDFLRMDIEIGSLDISQPDAEINFYGVTRDDSSGDAAIYFRTRNAGGVSPSDGMRIQNRQIMGNAAWSSATEPTFTWDSDPDTGIFRVGPDEIGFTVGGDRAMSLDSAGDLRGNGGTGAAHIGMDRVGNAATPAFAFEGDTDTGIYRYGANEIGFATGGAARWSISAFGHLEERGGSGTIRADGASASNPSYSFQGDNHTGMYQPWGDQIGFAGGGNQIALLRYSTTYSALQLRDALTNVGNHETLRLNRGTGSTMQWVGYYSSWEHDPETGDVLKANYTPLDLMDTGRIIDMVSPGIYQRTDTEEAKASPDGLSGWEMGIRLEDLVAATPLLTTKPGNDVVGSSPDEHAQIAVLWQEMKNLRRRLAVAGI